MRWSHYEGIPILRKTHQSFLSCRMRRQKAKTEALSQSGACQLLDLELPRLWNCKRSMLFKPSILWCVVMATWNADQDRPRNSMVRRGILAGAAPWPPLSLARVSYVYPRPRWCSALGKVPTFLCPV